MGYYRRQGLRFRDKVAVEVGCGDGILTALFMLAAGARRVVLVDPRLRHDEAAWLAAERLFRMAEGCAWEPCQALARIECYPDLAAVPAAFDGRVDLLCSHFALEHFRDLDGFFAQNRRLLAPDGVSHHRVDLTDHTYHVFATRPLLRRLAVRRRLFHLRYPDWLFRLLNDPKCFMNRVLLPEYAALARRHGLVMDCVERAVSPGVPVCRDLCARCASARPVDLTVSVFGMNLAHPYPPTPPSRSGFDAARSPSGRYLVAG